MHLRQICQPLSIAASLLTLSCSHTISPDESEQISSENGVIVFEDEDYSSTDNTEESSSQDQVSSSDAQSSNSAQSSNTETSSGSTASNATPP